ncbi:MAG: metal-sensing transcriptional repressor [Mizugakiibacter sp.]|uniref:metal-sensitive transcriptional regulator n=1 Tax=Mizugakiibacter sp. TaxID=1972610 RepID=UPI0031BEDED2|nr:metal-sensing transcriptional repressor [Xanthomonadaceae bacterium]
MSAKEQHDTEQAHRRRIAARLARIEGQMRGVQAMILANGSCEQVAQQLTAARRALDKAFYDMLACSLVSHVEASADLDDIRASTGELARLLAKFG